MIHVHVVGFGMGPHHLTAEAGDVLLRSDAAVAFRKGPQDPLLTVRAEICARFRLDLIEVIDPERDRRAPADYPGAVASWHAARADALVDVLATARARGTEAVAMLVWGDPSLYDSTLRLLADVASRMPLAYDVVAGISAPSLLAARHRIVLHEVGRPVHVTPARLLTAALEDGQRNVVAMLCADSTLDVVATRPDWSLWWGANLGAPSERLVAGTVRDVLPEVVAARAQARVEAGWVMDALLLRAPEALR